MLKQDRGVEPPFVVQQSLIEQEELDAILEFARRRREPEAARVLKAGAEVAETDFQLRRARIQSLGGDICREESWYVRIAAAVTEANALFFKRDISAVANEVNLNTYDQPLDFFGWHADQGGGYSARRQLTALLLVRVSPDLVGGEFEIREGSVYRVPLLPGDVIVFPAERVHRVLPINQGCRISLNLWWNPPS